VEEASISETYTGITMRDLESNLMKDQPVTKDPKFLDALRCIHL
jgi:hypothetical protein